MLIINAEIMTMSDRLGVIKNGYIKIKDKKIASIGDMADAPETDGEIIDAGGRLVTPGLVDAHSHIGMWEDGLTFEGDDGNEDTDPVTPQLRAIDGMNPFDRAFSDAVKAGITTVVTGPGSANPVGGQFAAVKTYGSCADDMVIKAPCAMKMALGENPKAVYNGKNQTPVTRMGTAALIRELFMTAREYAQKLEKYENDPENNDKPDFDIKLDAMLPVLRREIPVKFHAHRADDICTAIRIAKEFDVDFTIEHCTDGERIADVLAREGVDVNLGPTFGDRSKIELKDMSYGVYKTLSGKGLSVSIITDHPEITVENLPFCAVMAKKHGMDEYKALEGITVGAAKNCRIGDRVGTLEKGKDADIAVFTAPPTDFDAACVMTFINGKRVHG